MTRYRLEEKFREAETDAGPAFLRVSADHLIDLFVGVEEEKRALLLVCDHEPPDPPILEAISVHRRRRDDGKWALLVCLERSDLSSLFAYLAEDLVRATEHEASSFRASGLLIDRLKWWHRLLSRGRSRVLPTTELRGLIGELVFLRDCAVPNFGAGTAVDSWVGPFDAPRDFRFVDLDIEVKALTRDATTVRISSAEQLDLSSVASIVLTTVVLESANEEGERTFSVQALVDEVRSLCATAPQVVAALSERLWAAGYTDLPEYQRLMFRANTPVFYSCTKDFPRIDRAALPPGVVGCSYEIDLTAIEKFRVARWVDVR